MLNKVMLIGNVGRDPEVRYLDGNGQQAANSKVATFTLATSERFRDRAGNAQENTEWHNIVSFRNADFCENYIRKGAQIFVEGRIRTREFTDQTGTKKYRTEIVADNIQLLGRRGDGAQDGAPAYGGGYQAPAAPAYQAPAPSYQAPAAPAASGFQGGAPAQGGAAAPAAPAAPAAQPAPAPISVDLSPSDAPSDDLPF